MNLPEKIFMKKVVLTLIVSFLLFSDTFAQFEKQSDIKMRINYGSENVDLQSILQFEDIDLNKMSFSGNDLKDKDFQISIKEFERVVPYYFPLSSPCSHHCGCFPLSFGSVFSSKTS